MLSTKLTPVLSVAARLAATTLTTALSLLAVATANASATPLSWAGEASSQNWSATSNWTGSAPPANNESLGTVGFGYLGSGCVTVTSAATCYASNNNLSGLALGELTIDDSQPYMISGNGFQLGAGGVSVAPGSETASSATPAAAITAPITLTAPQTWTVTAGDENQQISFGSLSSSPTENALTVDLDQTAGNSPLIGFSGNVDVGPLTFDGGGLVAMYGPGTPASTTISDLNGTDGQAVTFENGALLFVSATNVSSGPLSTGTGTDVQLGQGGETGGSFTVHGDATLTGTALTAFVYDAGSTPSTDFSQFAVDGNLNLSSSRLFIDGGANTDGQCKNLTVGQSYPIVTATGTITGQFTNAANGSTVTIQNQCNSAPSTATAKLSYGPHTVYALIEAPGQAGDVPQSTASPTLSGAAAVGSTLTASNGTWSNSPTGFSYQWTRCAAHICAPVSGATGPTYNLTMSDLGASIYVEVTATNSLGSNTAASASVGPVALSAATIAQITSALKATEAVSGKASKLSAVLKLGGYRTRFSAPLAGKLSLSWTTTERVKHKRVQVTVATATATANAAGRVSFLIRITASGRKLLRAAHKSVTLATQATFVVPNATTVAATRSIKLPR